MSELMDYVHGGALSTLGLTVLIFGFCPGFFLRFIVRVYPKSDPRRVELVAELYVLSHWRRLFYVAQQFETVLHEGLPARIQAARQRTRIPKVVRARVKRFLITTIIMSAASIVQQIVATRIFGEFASIVSGIAGTGIVVPTMYYSAKRTVDKIRADAKRIIIAERRRHLQ